MAKYKILILIYLISVLSSSIASFFGINVQYLLRVPFLNLRWIDVAILFILINFLYSLNYNKIENNGILITLCFIYLIFETFQLLKSWQLNDLQSQVSWFICTLSFFILIDLSSFPIDQEKIIKFLKLFALAGAVVLIISNTITFYSFLKGNIITNKFEDRVLLNVEGQRESIYTAVLLSYVYTFSLYFLQKGSKLWEKAIFLGAILSIYLALVTSFSRGDLATIILISIIHIVVFSRKVMQGIIRVFAMILLLVSFYFMFGSTLREKGYDPVEKITQTVEFAADVDNPGWDKGRSVSRSFALSAWERNLWTGVGYDVLFHWGLPEEVATAHNFVITSLFHRGIIGTAMYLLILLLLFKNAIWLWLLLGKDNSYQNDMFKLLVIASFFWLIPFWNQEVIWEKYSLSIQFLYLGLITNIYMQKSAEERLTQETITESEYIPV